MNSEYLLTYAPLPNLNENETLFPGAQVSQIEKCISVWKPPRA